MSISRRLAAHRQAMASAESTATSPNPELDPNKVEPDEDEDDDASPTNTTKKKEPTMTDTPNAVAEARAEACAAERTRTNTVLTSEHYAGREKLAANLLSTPLSAEDIAAALAAAPKIEPSALVFDGDDAARAELRQGLANSQPAATSEADEAAAEAQAKATNYGWDDVHAEVRESRGI